MSLSKVFHHIQLLLLLIMQAPILEFVWLHSSLVKLTGTLIKLLYFFQKKQYPAVTPDALANTHRCTLFYTNTYTCALYTHTHIAFYELMFILWSDQALFNVREAQRRCYQASQEYAFIHTTHTHTHLVKGSIMNMRGG